MKTTLHFFLVVSFFGFYFIDAQNIGDFTSVTPVAQSSQFVIPSSHTFQVIAETGDAITGGTLPNTPDFSGYVPILGSSTNGYLSLNHETFPGAVTIFDINYNTQSKLWQKTSIQPIDFTATGVSIANCSGTITPWGTIVTCEEVATQVDFFPPNNGYGDTGWNIEIDPVTKSVVNNKKLWAMGNFRHENISIHSNNRTVYQGADDLDGFGYLYKFVATNAMDLSKGDLYVFSGSKNGTGSWVLINDSTLPSGAHELPNHRNNTIALAQSALATDFRGIEDVEIGPDGWVYFAVKGFPDQRVYRFQDSDPLEVLTSTVTMETFVGGPNVSYTIDDGTNVTSVDWGTGNDNLAFDGNGNLWVMQDDSSPAMQTYIWVVKNGHTQANPKVELFGITPIGSEPTGITFTPDYKYLFMSIQHPSSGNTANQVDAAGNTYDFELGTTLVIALNENLGSSLFVSTEKFNDRFELYPNPANGSQKLKISGINIKNLKLYTIDGRKLLEHDYNALPEVELDLQNIRIGIYLLKVNDLETAKLIVR